MQLIFQGYMYQYFYNYISTKMFTFDEHILQAFTWLAEYSPKLVLS